MKKAKRRRNNKTEQDSDSKSDREGILASHLRRTLASNRRHTLQNPRRGSGGGGGSNPRGYFIHHNFRYGPEPPAYKTPKPEYPGYTRREPERPPIQDRHSTEKSIDEKLFERFMRRFWKDETENDEAVLQEFPELQPKASTNQELEVTAKDLEKATITLEKYFPKTEVEPLTEYIEKKKQELKESEFDPETLLRQLETYPTEELREKTLAELNSEPAFKEEEVEGSKVETDKPASLDEAMLEEVEQYRDKHSQGDREPVEAEPNLIEPNPNVELEQLNLESSSESNPGQIESISAPAAMPEPLPEIEPILEAEVLSDVQDLMHELEPEIEEQEEVEPSY